MELVQNNEELIVLIKALTAQNEKAKSEVIARINFLLGKVAILEATITKNKTLTPETQAALTDLVVSIQGTDDIVPDEVIVPVAEPPVTEVAAV